MARRQRVNFYRNSMCVVVVKNGDEPSPLHIILKDLTMCRASMLDLLYEERAVPCHAPKSVGAAARRRVLAILAI